MKICLCIMGEYKITKTKARIQKANTERERRKAIKKLTHNLSKTKNVAAPVIISLFVCG